MKKMGREIGEDVSNEEIDEMVDEAMAETDGGKAGTGGDGSQVEPEDQGT
jgi:hypothetical protein